VVTSVVELTIVSPPRKCQKLGCGKELAISRR